MNSRSGPSRPSRLFPFSNDVLASTSGKVQNHFVSHTTNTIKFPPPDLPDPNQEVRFHQPYLALLPSVPSLIHLAHPLLPAGELVVAVVVAAV